MKINVIQKISLLGLFLLFAFSCANDIKVTMPKGPKGECDCEQLSIKVSATPNCLSIVDGQLEGEYYATVFINGFTGTKITITDDLGTVLYDEILKTQSDTIQYKQDEQEHKLTINYTLPKANEEKIGEVTVPALRPILIDVQQQEIDPQNVEVSIILNKFEEASTVSIDGAIITPEQDGWSKIENGYKKVFEKRQTEKTYLVLVTSDIANCSETYFKIESLRKIDEPIITIEQGTCSYTVTLKGTEGMTVKANINTIGKPNEIKDVAEDSPGIYKIDLPRSFDTTTILFTLEKQGMGTITIEYKVSDDFKYSTPIQITEVKKDNPTEEEKRNASKVDMLYKVKNLLNEVVIVNVSRPSTESSNNYRRQPWATIVETGIKHETDDFTITLNPKEEITLQCKRNYVFALNGIGSYNITFSATNECGASTNKRQNIPNQNGIGYKLERITGGDVDHRFRITITEGIPQFYIEMLVNKPGQIEDLTAGVVKFKLDEQGNGVGEFTLTEAEYQAAKRKGDAEIRFTKESLSETVFTLTIPFNV